MAAGTIFKSTKWQNNLWWDDLVLCNASVSGNKVHFLLLHQPQNLSTECILSVCMVFLHRFASFVIYLSLCTHLPVMLSLL